MVPESFEGFLTVAEAAEALRVSPQTIVRLARKGEIPAVRVGRQIRISRSILTANEEK